MDDNKIDNLLAQYSESLGRMPRSVPAANPSKTKFWKPVFATAAGLAVISVVLMPRRAEAAPMDKVMSALKNTKFWMATCTSKDENQPRVLQYRSYHQGDKLRGESPVFGGAPRTYVTIIDGDTEYSDHSDQPFILKSKFVLDPRLKPDSMAQPLKNSLQLVGGEMRSDFVRTDDIHYQGSNAYSLSLKSKKTGKKVYEVIVQKESNLPLAVLVNNVDARTKRPFEYRIDYSYVPLNKPELFKPDPKKILIDEDAEKKRLVDSWTLKIQNGQLPTVLESSISPDGTIWIAYVSDGERNHYVYPRKIDGSEYVLGMNYSLSDWKAVADPRVKGKDVLVASFYALNPKFSPKSSAMVTWSSRPGELPAKPVVCPLATERWNFPSYFPPFMNSISFDGHENALWRSRGDTYRSRKMFKDAANAYMKSYEIMKSNHYFVNAYQNPLRAAAECYDKLGDHAMAKKLRNMMPKGLRPQF